MYVSLRSCLSWFDAFLMCGPASYDLLVIPGTVHLCSVFGYHNCESVIVIDMII